MTRKRLGTLIGGGIVLIALVLVLSTVPLTVHNGKSTVSHIEGSDSAGACVVVTFDATFDYSVAHPLLDLWGFAEVRDLTIDHVHMTGSSDPKCSGVGGGAVAQVTDAVVLPNCDRQWSEASSLVLSGRFAECEGNAVFYAAEPVDGSDEVSFGFEGPQSLPGSGLIRGPWCPELGATVVASNTWSGATNDSGDLCLDLS